MSYEASVNGTGAVDVVAQEDHVAFVAFRAASGGTPDPPGMSGHPS